MFLFSGTFFPIGVYPAPVQVFMELVPLYHGVSLFRGLTTGLLQPHMLWDLAYLIAFCAGCLWLAMRQMERKLIK
jgi:lipooligosaccharide transport system permease protein